MFEKTRHQAASIAHEARRLFGIPSFFVHKLGQLALHEAAPAELHPQAQDFLDQLAFQQERYANRPAVGKNRVFKVSTTIESDDQADHIIGDIYGHFGLKLDSLALAKSFGQLDNWRVNPAKLDFSSLKVQRTLFDLKVNAGTVVVPDLSDERRFSLLLATPGPVSEACSFIALTGLQEGDQTEPLGLTYVEFMPKAT